MSRRIFHLLAIPLTILISSVTFTSCKGKANDVDVKTSVDKALASNPDLSGVMTDVKNGVTTISGEVNDAGTKTVAETVAKGVKGVKSVINNLTITPAPAPVVITADDPLKSSVDNVLKDFAGVTAAINDGVVTLTGEIKRTNLQKLIMALNSLKPKKIENKLIIK